MKILKKSIAFILVLSILCICAYAVPSATFDEYTDTATMQYLKIEQLSAYLMLYHLDSGYNDKPIQRAYELIFKTDEKLTNNELRSKLIDYFNESKDNYYNFAFEMCHMYDAHTYFLDTKQYSLAFPDNSNYDGIGIRVRQFGTSIIVSYVYDSSPASEADLLPNDRIIKIGDIDIRTMPYDESIKIFEESAKKKVKLSVLKYDSGNIETVEIVPEKLVIPNVEYEIFDGGIGYIKIYRFGDTKYNDLLNSAKAFFTENKIKKVILDLRDNPGGDVEKLVYTINMFIPEKNVKLFEVASRYDPTTYFSDGTGNKFDKIAVLVNESSASSSEICAGSLSDTGYAKIIGTLTYGKARGQTTLSFIDNYLVHLSISEAKLPVRGFYHGIGISPDIEAKMRYECAVGEDFDYKFNEKINCDSAHDAIAKLQERLYILGYLTEFELGTFDAQTLSSLHEIQNTLKIIKSDDCTVELMNMLNKLCEKYKDAYYIYDEQINSAIRYLNN